MAQRTGLTGLALIAGLGPWLSLLVSQAKEAGTIPPRAGDRKGDLGQAVIGLAVPGKAIGQHHHTMRSPVPFSNQHGAWRQVGSLPVEALQPVRHRQSFVSFGAIENLSGRVIEIAETIGLD